MLFPPRAGGTGTRLARGARTLTSFLYNSLAVHQCAQHVSGKSVLLRSKLIACARSTDVDTGKARGKTGHARLRWRLIKRSNAACDFASAQTDCRRRTDLNVSASLVKRDVGTRVRATFPTRVLMLALPSLSLSHQRLSPAENDERATMSSVIKDIPVIFLASRYAYYACKREIKYRRTYT